jgi:hypothetical protein
MKTKLNLKGWLVLAAFLLAGLHEANAWYSPSQQRWLNRDPLGEQVALARPVTGAIASKAELLRYGLWNNLYRFDQNNPMGFVDPDGQTAIAIPIGGAILIGGTLIICELIPDCRANMERLAREAVRGIRDLCRALPRLSPRRKNSECDKELAKCIANPWQPDRGYGTRKDCRACYNECLNDGKWPSYKCAN